MPQYVLGWRVWGLGRPAQEQRRGRTGGARLKVAAPPAGTGGAAHVPAPTDGPPTHGDSQEQQEQQSKSHAAATFAVTSGSALGVAAMLSGARNWGFLLKAVSLHGANLAASLAARPLAPLHARLQAQLASTEAVQTACRQLGVESLSELQDLLNCVILSEHVYKIVDHSQETSVSLINGVKAQFPPHLATLRGVQWAQPHVRHRFLLGESDDALYVSFMGTKLPRDMATNANLFQEEVVLDAAMLSSGASAEMGEAPGAGRTLGAHRGFLARARSIPIHQLYREARARGKRLVLCGHSLGGAVASLCAIRLLQHLPPNLHHTVSCYGFATPAVGNDALATTVVEQGWDARIRNYISPDDPIPNLLSFHRPPADKAAGQQESSSGSGSADAATMFASAAVPAAAAAAAVLAVAAAAPPSVLAMAAAGAAVGVNNIQSVPWRAAAPAQQRMQPIASHLEVGGGREDTAADGKQAGLLHAQSGLASTSLRAAALPRSSSAPALLAEVAVAEAVVEHTAAPTAAAAAAANSADSGAGAASKRNHGGPQHWLGQPFRRASTAAMAAAAPPMRAVVERAGSAARLVAVPLSAAASVPMRAAPQYLPLGRQLYILPDVVSAVKPAPGQLSVEATAPPAVAAAVTAAPAVAARRWPAFWRASPAVGSGTGSQDDDVEDNVDVAAAASLQGGDVAGAASSGDGEDASGAAAAGAAGKRKRRGMFEAHRMATYRNRLLGICQASIEGHLLVRSLPMLPNLPRPGDVAASELLAPPMFPLRAVATLQSSSSATASASQAAQQAPQAAAGAAASSSSAAAKSNGVSAHSIAKAAAEAQAAVQQGHADAPPWRPIWFWQRLLAARNQRRGQEPPLELLIRVEGRGLANVTQAWIEGIPSAFDPSASSKEGSEAAAAAPAAATMAQVDIVQQPLAKAAPLPLQARPPLPVLGQLSAFVSW